MKAPVTAVKHYHQTSLSSVTNGAIATINHVNAVQPPDANASNEVVEGAIVKAIYLEYWLQNSSTSIGSFTAGLYKLPGVGTQMGTADAAALFNWDNKKNLLFVTQGLAPSNDTQQLNLIRQYVKIPKGKQRMGLNDKLVWFIRNNNGTDDINYCGFSTYKEYR